MLSLRNNLLFPHFIHQGEVSFKSWSDSQKTTDIYKLDWDPIDNTRKERCLKDADTSEVIFPGTLPEPYDSWVKDMLFAIPNMYMEEIRRCARLALIEWGASRPFDTMIREICLEPAIYYVYVSFRLIADCLYDEKTEYFYRGEDKSFATQAMLYKFWSFQTGWGLIRDHAQFRRIITPHLYNTNILVRKFIKTINEHEKKHFKPVREDSKEEESIEKDEIYDFLHPEKKRTVLEMEDFSYSIKIRDFTKEPEPEISIVDTVFTKVSLCHTINKLPYFSSRYEMKAIVFMENPEIFKKADLCHFKLSKGDIAFIIRNAHVKGFRYLEVGEDEDLIDKLFINNSRKIEVRIGFNTIETKPLNEEHEYETPIIKKMNLSKVDDEVLQELGDKVIKKKGKIMLRSVMDNILEIQESTPVGEIKTIKLNADTLTEAEGEYPDELKNCIDYTKLMEESPESVEHSDVMCRKIPENPIKFDEKK